MVPLAVTMKATGAAVGWDQEKQVAIVVTEHRRIEVPIGESYLYCNNEKIENDTKAVVKDGRTYLPIAAVLIAAGYTVEWDANTNTVNAYNFDYDSNELVPYSTSDKLLLLRNLLKGDVVYLNGQYYATPEYVKMLSTVDVIYLGDDLNTATYPRPDRFELADVQPPTTAKEWVTVEDLGFVLINFSSFPVKGFSGGLAGRSLYHMPSLPDDFTTNPVAGVYDGITVKVENGEILFRQEDLLSHGILLEKIVR